MSRSIDRITLRGFKSVQSMDGLQMHNLNVLIGPNGAGKSNFIDFFRMVRAMASGGLQAFVNEQGGADGLFHLGPKATPTIHARIEFGPGAYEFGLKATAASGLMIDAERTQLIGGAKRTISHGVMESQLEAISAGSERAGGNGAGVDASVHDAIFSWVVYHFHDTSMLAPMRREQSARDYERLRPDASNIAAFLLRLRDKDAGRYAMIRDTVRLIAPFFDDFLLRPEEKAGDQKLRLEWRQKGTDFPFQPGQLSDGTLRFICLATALSQPALPTTVVIDEPELGLHPFAITLLADLIKSASQQTQVVISTQSPALLDHFAPEDVIVVNRTNGRSQFQRLDAAELAEWLEDYSVGDLWQKNVVRGGPEGA